jgi:hypothetical protein
MQANRLPLFVSDSGKQVQLASVYTALLTEGRDEKRLNPAAGGSLRSPARASRVKSSAWSGSRRSKRSTGSDIWC